ncbi:MAG: EamA family transporter [Steroidobacteraceae bacterium]
MTGAAVAAARRWLTPLAYIAWPAAQIPARSWVSAAALGQLCTGIAYLLYYRIMGRIGAPRTANVTYLIPLFGVLWAWLLLGELSSIRVAIAGPLISGGVALSQRQ